MGTFQGEEPRWVESGPFVQEMKQSHQTFTGKLGFGDVVVFVADGETRDVEMINGVPKRVWYPMSSTLHGAIYLGEGLIFQKENIGTGIFSIDSLSRSRDKYEKSFNSSPQNRGQVLVEKWQLIP